MWEKMAVSGTLMQGFVKMDVSNVLEEMWLEKMHNSCKKSWRQKNLKWIFREAAKVGPALDEKLLGRIAEVMYPCIKRMEKRFQFGGMGEYYGKQRIISCL